VAFAYAQDEACKNCQTVVTWIQSIVTDNSSETWIIERVEYLCALLPTEYEATCKQGIEDNADEIIKAIINEENPEDICKLLNLCIPARGSQYAHVDLSHVRHVATAMTPNKKQAAFDVVGCTVCQFVCEQIEDFVAQNGTETDIIKYVETFICPVFPEYKAQCDATVEQLPQLIKYLEQEYPPLACCTMVNQCPSPSPKTINHPHLSV